MTAAALVPSSPRFSQWQRGLAHRGRPVTSAVRPSSRRPPVPAACACALGRAPALPPGLPCASSSAAPLAEAAGTSSRTSPGCSPSMVRAGARRGTCSSAVASSCSWWSPHDGCRAQALRRLPDFTSAAARSRRPGGSPDRRGVDQLEAAAKAPARAGRLVMVGRLLITEKLLFGKRGPRKRVFSRSKVPVPWSPVIPVEVGPKLTGGDTRLGSPRRGKFARISHQRKRAGSAE